MTCIEFFVKDNADVRVRVLLRVKFKVKNAFWCIELLNQIRLYVGIRRSSQSLLSNRSFRFFVRLVCTLLE